MKMETKFKKALALTLACGLMIPNMTVYVKANTGEDQDEVNVSGEMLEENVVGGQDLIERQEQSGEEEIWGQVSAVEGALYSVGDRIKENEKLLIAGNANWRYEDNNQDLYAARFYEKDFDDSSWGQNVAPLGYPATDYNPIFGAVSQGTVVNNVNKPNALITYYFRNEFTVDAVEELQKLEATVGIDDGFVMYINGAEVNRTYMNAGEVTHSTCANYVNEPSSSQGTVTIDLTHAMALLEEGTNQIAVSVHNRDANSSDIYFDMELKATYKSDQVDQTALVEALAKAAAVKESDFYTEESYAVFEAALQVAENILEDATQEEVDAAAKALKAAIEALEEKMLVGDTDYTIINPYDNVDWNSFGQYKADFHAHSTNSDGSNLTKDMVEDHYAKGFDVLAMTDHNYLTTSWDAVDKGAMTTERMNEILAGTDRNGKGMTQVSNGNEQSKSDHVNTFWAAFNNGTENNLVGLEESIARAEQVGGISHINHPGRYTGGKNTSVVNGVDLGREASDNKDTIKKYVDLFMKYQSCVGMEIINKKDNESYSDRILWDNILMETMPEGRFVWGFSNDDTHSLAATGYSFNMMLMPENTGADVRFAMEDGDFYAVAKYAFRELGREGYVPQGETPVITNIEVDQEENTITIASDYANRVEWIADGEVIKVGDTIDFNEHENKIGSYVRANIMGDGGIAFTQPFRVTVGEEVNVEQTVTVAAQDVQVQKGGKVSVPVTITGARGMGRLAGKINYDHNLLTLETIQFDGFTLETSNTSEEGTVLFEALNESGLGANEETQIINLTFTATDAIVQDVETAITLTNMSANKANTSGSPENMKVIVKNAVVTIVKVRLQGDINEDGQVDGKDGLMLLQYITGLRKFTEEEIKVADFKPDGKLDTADVLAILNHSVSQLKR